MRYSYWEMDGAPAVRGVVGQMTRQQCLAVRLPACAFPLRGVGAGRCKYTVIVSKAWPSLTCARYRCCRVGGTHGTFIVARIG